MQRAVTIIILVAVVTTLSFLWFRDNEVSNYSTSHTGTIVAFGDSLVEGTGSSRGGGFVTMLSKDLGIPIVNLGKTGDTTASAFSRVNEVTKLRPKITLILLGGNDYLRGVPEYETFSNLGKIIEAIQASGSMVVLIGVEDKTTDNNHRELFESLVKKYQTAYVPDVLEDTLGVPRYMSDSLHPNDKGYRVMAERVKYVLERYL